ncbi:MAG: cellulase family glycosylhydrolase [Candidatus Promineifilaceae bacterium]
MIAKKILPVVALLFLIVGLWPDANSLYDLTGEEELPGQVRGLFNWFYTAVRPQPNLDATDVNDYADVSPFGMNTFLQNEVLPEVREQSLQMLNQAGIHYIRQQFPWEDIEIHGKGDYIDRRNDPNGVDAWAKYDNIVDLAEQNNIEIIARLDNPPAWTRALTNTIGTLAPPDNYNDYGDYVAAVVGRYKGRITYFQLWNEPNTNAEWGNQPINPEAFTELLCIGYHRAKEANPNAVILAGALSPTIALNDQNQNDLVFLQRMYLDGAGSCFDIFSAQGYGLFSGPTDQRVRPTVINYPHIELLRDVMTAYGDAEKSIWISEVGWNAVPDGFPTPFGQVSLEQQARYAAQLYERAQEDWPFIGVINYWFFKHPNDEKKSEPVYYFRLLEPDFTKMPAFDALADYATSETAAKIKSKPAWKNTWQESRPYFILIGGSVLFFWLLWTLSKETTS